MYILKWIYVYTEIDTYVYNIYIEIDICTY